MKPRRTPLLSLCIALVLPLLVALTSYAAPQSEAAAAVTVVAQAPAPAAPADAPATADDQDVMRKVEAMASNPAVRMGSRVLLAVLLFLAGWIAAKLAGYGVFQLLSRTELDNQLAHKLGISMLMKDRKNADHEGSIERFVGRVVFWLVMLLVIVGVLQFAGLTQVAGPIEGLVRDIMDAVPSVAKAGLILFVAYVAGRILKMVVSGALDAAGVDRRFAELTEGDQGASPSFSDTAGKVVFGLILFFGVAAAFEALAIPAVSEPLHNAVDHIVAILPRLGVAAVLIALGYFGGRIARALVRNVLQGVGFDKLAARAHLDRISGTHSASDVVGVAVMVFILGQATIASLNELGLETLSVPLMGMMGQFWAVLPALAVSTVIVLVAVFVGKLLRRVVSAAVRNLGLDRFMENLGFAKLSERDDKLGEYSEMLGFAVQVGVLLLGIAQALDNMQLETWALYVNSFLGYIVKNIAVATFVVGVGFAIGNYVRAIIGARGDDETTRWMGAFARYAVLVFAFTMAVQQLDVAEDFVLMTFGLLFGALCLGAALAFGLGGREVAADVVKRRYEAARTKLGQRPAPPPAPPRPPSTPPTSQP